jgi:S-(hydroxymethyl)glutathione dehydrogenase/alcohol dehydrogenase
MKTKAAILTELNQPLVIEDIQIPDLEYGQVLVRIEATSVCGSQIGEMRGVKGEDKWLPHLLGHEAGGIVESIGSGVSKVSIGDHVVVHWRKGSGIEAKTPTYLWNGNNVNAGWVTTFQQKSIVSENRITPIAKDIPFDIASLMGCCATTAFGVLENDTQLKENETILIIGVGGVGLIQVIAARLKKAQTIIVVDIDAKKLTLAKTFGATHTINAKTQNMRDAVISILGRQVLDVAVENTGIIANIESAYELTGPCGRTILVGVPMSDQKVSIHTLALHFGKVLTGSHGGSTFPDEDIPKLIQLWQEGSLPIEGILSQPSGLDDINDVITHMQTAQSIRGLIKPNSIS